MPHAQAGISSSLTGTEIHQVKRYTLRKLVGEGGMGWIYLAYDPVLERDVALKVMKAEVPDAERRRFRREAIFGARFCHPSIVRVFDMGAMPAPGDTVGSTEWFSMEYLPGVDMEDVVHKKARTSQHAPLRSVGEVFRQLLAALQYAHDCKVVHRDVKPANIFVTKDPNTHFVTTKLLDFGVALDLDGPKRVEPVCGDPRYMAPEQTHKGVPVDPRADIYAAGISLWEIVTGVHPFQDLDDRHVKCWIEAQRTRLVGSIIPHLPRGTDPHLAHLLDGIIRKACSKRPDQRYSSALELQRELLRTIDEASAAVPQLRPESSADRTAAALRL